MKAVRWNTEKATWLKDQSDRNKVGFEECAVLIEAGQILDLIANPSSNFPDQKTFVLEVENYVFLVPFVETEDEIFLKTVYPSRKLTAVYLGKNAP